MPKEAQDLIRSLLKLEPSERLGAGSSGSNNDLSSLKVHPFFHGVNFSTLHN